jgi:hypothetical protein
LLESATQTQPRSHGSPKLVATGAFILSGRSARRAWRYRTGLKPLPDQEPPTLVVVQGKQLDGNGLGPLSVERFDIAEKFAAAAHDDDAPASQLGGGGLLSGGFHRRGVAGIRAGRQPCTE